MKKMKTRQPKIARYGERKGANLDSYTLESIFDGPPRKYHAQIPTEGYHNLSLRGL